MSTGFAMQTGTNAAGKVEIALLEITGIFLLGLAVIA